MDALPTDEGALADLCVPTPHFMPSFAIGVTALMPAFTSPQLLSFHVTE